MIGPVASLYGTMIQKVDYDAEADSLGHFEQKLEKLSPLTLFNQVEQWSYARPSESHLSQTIFAALEGGAGELWGYIADQQLVAVACLTGAYLPANKRHLMALIVCPGMRRRGHAKRFLSEMVDTLASTEGVNCVSIATFSDQAIFWQRVGFAPVRPVNAAGISGLRYFECKW